MESSILAERHQRWEAAENTAQPVIDGPIAMQIPMNRFVTEKREGESTIGNDDGSDWIQPGRDGNNSGNAGANHRPRGCNIKNSPPRVNRILFGHARILAVRVDLR